MKIFVLNLFLVCVIFAGCATNTLEPGVLKGDVTIGPLVPVERPGIEYEIPCEVYMARKVMIYDKNREKLVKQVDIDCEGQYRVELIPGFYVIDINRTGIDNSSQVPTKVEIRPGETYILDIDIDTGIR